MIGIVTGNSIDKNRDGTKNVRLLQVKISDDDDVQTAELYGPAGDDSCPPDGSFVRIIDLGNNWKIAVAVNDGVEPTMNAGEKQIYSSDNGTVKAKIKFLKNGNLEFNGNGKNFVTGDELQTVLNSFWAATQAAILAGLNAIVPPGIGSVGAAAFTAAAAAASVDITSAKTTTVKTGG